MDEFNNLEDLTNQTPEQPFEARFDPDQSTNESTYWESQTPDQNYTPSDDISLQETGPQETPTLDAPASEIPAQFYQYDQQQMNGEITPTQPFNVQPQLIQPGYPTPGIKLQPQKKKTRSKMLVVIVILLLVLSGAATAYAFQDSLMNTFVLLTKSPADYYAYVEKNALHEVVDDLTPHMNLLKQDMAYDVTTDITLNRESLDSLMQSSIGLSLIDLESMIGLPIESIGLDLLLGYNGGNMNETIGVRLNQVNIITLELFMDMLKQEILIRLPELSPAYLKQSFATSENSASLYIDQLELLTADRTADLLKRYSNIIVDHITNVELEKNVALALDTLDTKCNKLTITLTEKDLYNIISAILEEARDDEYIMDLLPMFELTKEEYQKILDESKVELQASIDANTSNESAQMIVYVDSHGHIIGRELGTKDSLAAIGYTFLNKDNYDELQVSLVDDTGNVILKCFGYQTKEEDAFDGIITVEYNDPTSELMSNVSFDIKYEDVRTETKDNHIFQYGSYTLSSLDLMGIQVMAENSVTDGIQYNKLIFQMGASPLVTIDTKVEYLNGYMITLPTDTSTIYDTTQAESFLATFNLEAYISNLSEQLGVDLQSLLNSFLPGLSIQ